MVITSKAVRRLLESRGERTDDAVAVREGEVLWTPDAQRLQGCGVERFRRWVETRHELVLADYEALRAWSVAHPERFWAAVWDYFDVRFEGSVERVLDGRDMPGARWFEGARLNYAEHLLRAEPQRPDAIALYHAAEGRPPATLTWAALGGQARRLATRLRALGVQPGDCVAAYLPNGAEAAVAMLATTAIGAVWSIASIELSADAALERLEPLQPRILIAADGGHHAGEPLSRAGEIARLARGLPSLQTLIWVPTLDPTAPAPIAPALSWAEALAGPPVAAADFHYTRVDDRHPLWVLYSSGATGRPKAVVHGHVGLLLEHLKLTAFHLDLDADSCALFHVTPAWMMWNVLLASWLQGAAVVLYDGAPLLPCAAALWRLVDRCGVTHLGVTPGYVQRLQKLGYSPRQHHALPRLKNVLLAGSPAVPQTFAWFYREVKEDLWVSSQSGGTEVASAFLGASPTLPVRAGQFQTRALGMDVRAWDADGEPVLDQIGELVVCTPAPSMPLRFWGDDEQLQGYRKTCFSRFPGVWTQRDALRLLADGSGYLYGGSDSMLDRYGICIASAEIYRSVEQLEEVLDSLIVCCELAGGRFFMPMFLRLRSGATLDAKLRERILRRVRQDCSPRHMPDQLYQVEDIPYTLTGKKMEVPVRRILTGSAPEEVASRHAMRNPQALDWFLRFRLDNEDMLTG